MATTFTVEIDWDHDGTWTDETARTRRAQIASGFDAAGRGDANVAGVGRCTLTMDNTSQRFSPGNATGPLYGKLLPRRAVRVRATDGVDTWTLFRGFIERIQPDTGVYGAGECVIACVDAVALLARQRIGVVYADSKPVDDAISAVVSATYTPPATSYSDNGDSLAHYGRSWLPERTTAVAALREICEAVYGRFYIARDGTATYLTRDDRLDSSEDAAIHIGNSAAYWQRVRDVQSGNLLGLWRLNEASGTDALDSSGNSYHGTYVGATLQGLLGPDLVYTIECDGVNDYVTLTDASLLSAFNGAAGTLFIWGKVDSGTWTDGVTRDLAQVALDSNNYILLRKGISNNLLQFWYRAGGVTKLVQKSSVSTPSWFSLAISWDKAADQMKAYFNGVQEGATQTGLGVWSGTPSDISFSDLTFDWDGGLALAALWDVALSDAKILQIGSV